MTVGLSSSQSVRLTGDLRVVQTESPGLDGVDGGDGGGRLLVGHVVRPDADGEGRRAVADGDVLGGRREEVEEGAAVAGGDVTGPRAASAVALGGCRRK